jgi:hypothetical protein
MLYYQKLIFLKYGQKIIKVLNIRKDFYNFLEANLNIRIIFSFFLIDFNDP